MEAQLTICHGELAMPGLIALGTTMPMSGMVNPVHTAIGCEQPRSDLHTILLCRAYLHRKYEDVGEGQGNVKPKAM